MSPLLESTCVRVGVHAALCALIPTAAGTVSEFLTREPVAVAQPVRPQPSALLQHVDGLATGAPTPELRVLVSAVETFDGASIDAVLDALGEALEPESPHAELTREALLGRLELAPRTTLIEALQQRLDARPLDARVRSTTFTLIARVGRPEDVPVAIEALGPDADPEAARELGQAVTAVVARAEDPLTPLGKIIVRASPHVAQVLVQAVGVSNRADGLELLASLLGDSRELDGHLLMQMGLLGARQPDAVDPATAAEVRSFLWSSDPGLVRTSLVAVAQIRDDEAVPDLVELLADGEPAVRESAHRALQEITGLGLSAEPERWRTWFEAERAWFDDRGLDLREQLGRASSKQVVSALTELAQHRWRRHETAARIEQLLQHPEPTVRHLACTALGQLGSNRSIAALRGTLDDPSGPVRKAAESALTAIE